MSELNTIEAGASDELLQPPHKVEIKEKIPLKRLTSTEENAERQRIYKIFVQYDVNGNNLLDIKELKKLISEKSCREMSRGLIYHILRINDPNGDKQLNFEEFYTLSKNNKWLITSFMDNYCNSILPPAPARGEADHIAEEHVPFKLWPPPLTMIIFSLIEIVFFFVDVIHFHNDPDNTKNFGENLKGPAATLFIYNPYRRFEAWRFITYMFVHVGVMHLFMNLLIQIFLGIALELRHYWWRVSLVYLAGVLAGSIGTSLTTPTSFLAGASGGVYALLAAHIATVIINWNETRFAAVQFIAITVYCFVDLGTSVYRHLNDDSSTMGYNAHLCGAIAGLLVGIAVLRNIKRHKWETILWWIAVLGYCALMFSSILIHIFYKHYFPVQQWRYAKKN